MSITLKGMSDSKPWKDQRDIGVMSIRHPETRAEHIKAAIMWLQDALDEDRDPVDSAPTGNWCIERAREACDQALRTK
jgi:hypothetical protein